MVVTRLMDRVEQDFLSPGNPLHVADPGRSMFHIMTLQEFDSMNDEQLQELHAGHHLLVHGYSEASYGFDAKGMATLATPTRVFTIQGELPCSERM
jgi:hypothetical protein